MFYLIPPRGTISLSILEDDVHARFNFFFKIMQARGINSRIKENFRKINLISSEMDCLIEGSRRDIACHYIFRIACVKCGHMQRLWIAAEKELFQYRLACGGSDSIYKSIITLRKDCRNTRSFQCVSEKYEKLLRQISVHLNTLIDDKEFIYCANRTNCCHSINVSWILIEELVAKREVKLKDGMANIPCIHLLSFLSSIFEKTLHYGIEQLKPHAFNYISDSRIINLVESISINFERLSERKLRNVNKKPIMCTDVEKQISNFPLCMQQLHVRLKKSHRLSHYERLRYSLFLKDIGMPLEENILFWKYYYSKEPRCSHSGCRHMWKGADSKRYEYSIRHMYGMEGRRVQYRSHSCFALQALKPQPLEDSGCPYNNLQESSLTASNRISKIQRDFISQTAANGNPSMACGLHLSALTHKHVFKKTPKLSRCSTTSNVIESKDTEQKRTSSLFPKWNSLSRNSSHSCNRESSSCLTCNCGLIAPQMSFFSPKEFFRLTQCKHKDI